MDTESTGAKAEPSVAAKLGKWITLVSAAATVVLTGVNARTANRVQEAEVRQRDQQLAIESSRERVARFVGAEADEIAFVPNTSTGINMSSWMRVR